MIIEKPPHTPHLRRYKYWGSLPVPKVPKVRRIDFVERIRRGWVVKMNMIKKRFA